MPFDLLLHIWTLCFCQYLHDSLKVIVDLPQVPGHNYVTHQFKLHSGKRTELNLASRVVSVVIFQMPYCKWTEQDSSGAFQKQHHHSGWSRSAQEDELEGRNLKTKVMVFDLFLTSLHLQLLEK